MVGKGPGGIDVQIKLCVVSIATVVNSMPADDTTKGKRVDGEEGWTKDRTLGDPTCESVG